MSSEFKELINIAKSGNKQAQYLLGLYKYRDKEFSEAVHWFSASAEQGEMNAQYYLGCCYLRGEGVVKDEEKAMDLITESAERGNSDAQYYLAICCVPRYDIDEIDTLTEAEMNQNSDKVFLWTKKSAKQGNVEAQYSLGIYYLYGYGTSYDCEKAIHWLTRAAENGYETAQYHLALLYTYGEKVKCDYDRAAWWLSKVIQGH